jgi:Domain of unknown function (DUF4340)
MQGVKSTLLLFVVLVGLVAYIYFVDRNRPVSETEERENVFTGVAADDIEEIEIKAEDGERSLLRKAEGKWTIVEPVSAETDAGELSSITSSIADIDIQRVVEESPPDLKRFGLDPPRIDVAFRAKGQKDFRRLHLGDKTPTGSDLYARTPDKPRVFLVGTFLESTFNKNTFALRDKKILKLERDKVETVELTSGATTLQFAKSGTEWTIVKPIAARGDFGTIEGIVERLSSAEMQGIVAPEAQDLRKYGLDKPTATVVAGTGSSRATLTLGRTENALVFAKDASRPTIFTVAPTIKDDVFKPLNDLRRKDLFDSRSFTANRLEITRGAETFTFEKTKGKDEKDIWKDSAGKDADAAKIEDLLSRLTSLRATSFESGTHASLKSPALTATVRFDEGKTEAVAFGRAGSDVFASRMGEPGSAKLEASSFDEANKALDALK